MTTYSPNNAFTAAEIYDLSDLVQGGAAGAANVPLKALADQTNYLFQRLVSFESVKFLTGNYSYDTADTRNQFVFSIADNTTFTLPDVTTMRIGAIVPIRAKISAIKALTVQCYGTQVIAAGGIFGADVPAMFMHNGESLVLVAASDHWEVLIADGNFYKGIGETFQGRIVGKNMFTANGNIVNRADVPRINEYISKLTAYSQIVDDTTWLSDPGGQPLYRGCYSYGNTTTTLRLPDERGMFIRNLDLGRGVDLSRLFNQPGGYEPDAIVNHAHTGKRGDSYSGSGDAATGYVGGGQHGNVQTDFLTKGPVNIDGSAINTASETIVKNIGKIPLILY